MSNVEIAIKESGGPSAVAARLGVSVQRLSNWMDRGVPTDQCAGLERATDGRVRRWHMRPSDWHLIWPELVGSDGAPRVPATARAA